MNTLTGTKNITMWTCEKYGVAMLSTHADDFCARRFAAAQQNGSSSVIGFIHCRTCPHGAKMFRQGGANRRRDLSRKKSIIY